MHRNTLWELEAMAKRDSNPNKGFFKELASNPKTENKKESFSYSKPLTPKSSSTVSMNTPRRLSEFKSVASPKTNIKSDFSQVKNSRKGK